jgi:hypothetical protein
VASIVGEQRDLVFDFFADFSRFEFALKLKPQFLSDERGFASANWRVFAESIRGRFQEISERPILDAMRI